jgi:serine/threonine protein kinase
MTMGATVFGRYYLLERLASGGMGEIWAAMPRSAALSKLCALKTVLRRGDRETIARFREEGLLMLAIQHPNIVNVFEMGEVGNRFYLAMELVDGKDLGQLLNRGLHNRHPLPIAAALYIARELLEGLDYCHRMTDQIGGPLGLIHRDISPTNIMISFDGHVKLADFGLAKCKVSAIHTQPQVVLGKSGYMAPERLLDRRVDQRADLFAAGVLLYEMLTNERFIKGREPREILDELYEKRPRPSDRRSSVPPALDRLVAKATAWAPEERFQSAEQMLDAIEKALVVVDPYFKARNMAEEMHAHFDVDFERDALHKRLGGTVMSLRASGHWRAAAGTSRQLSFSERTLARTMRPRSSPRATSKSKRHSGERRTPFGEAVSNRLRTIERYESGTDENLALCKTAPAIGMSGELSDDMKTSERTLPEASSEFPALKTVATGPRQPRRFSADADLETIADGGPLMLDTIPAPSAEQS